MPLKIRADSVSELRDMKQAADTLGLKFRFVTPYGYWVDNKGHDIHWRAVDWKPEDYEIGYKYLKVKIDHEWGKAKPDEHVLEDGEDGYMIIELAKDR